MATRRMISVNIINSARFIMMPQSTQALYFHLVARGDDDGVVEAFPVMRLVGATEDELKILVAKKFISILNDDLVSHITDWLEHNKIRSDRKVDSIYKNLLVEVLPDVALIEAKQRKDRPKDNHVATLGRPKDNHVATNGQPVDGVVEVRLVEVSVVEGSINTNTPNGYTEEFENFWSYYGKKGNKKKSHTQWKKLSENQKSDIRSNIKDYIESTGGDRLQFRKNAETYLNANNEHWNDEIVRSVSTGKKTRMQKEMEQQGTKASDYDLTDLIMR